MSKFMLGFERALQAVLAVLKPRCKGCYNFILTEFYERIKEEQVDFAIKEILGITIKELEALKKP